MRASCVFFLFLCLCLVLCCPVVSEQNPSASHEVNPPSLPVVNYGACPFEGCTFREWTVTKETPLYSSWGADRVLIGNLSKDQQVTGLTGVYITKKPDTIRVLVDIPELSLKRGDTVFRYMYRGEGLADIWANGRWMKETDCSFISEKEIGGCLKECSAKVIEEGDKEWWVKIRTSSGQVGWAKAEDNFNGMDVLALRHTCTSVAPIETGGSGFSVLDRPPGRL